MTYFVAIIVIIAITIKAVRIYDYYVSARRQAERMRELEARIVAWEDYLADDTDIDDTEWLRRGRINEERLNQAIREVSDDYTPIHCDSIEDLCKKLGITDGDLDSAELDDNEYWVEHPTKEKDDEQ